MRTPGTHGGTLLHVAARRNLSSKEALNLLSLLRLGADVNRSDILGRTALHRAVQNGAADAARLLIAHGAGLDAKDWQGRTPLDLAEARGGVALARVIREKISLRQARKVKAVRVARAGERR